MASNIRPPAVAGMYYPANTSKLRNDIQRYLDEASPPAISSLKALIVPHAGYLYSGPVAAFGYKLLQNAPVTERILILGPSHRAWFEGAVLADVVAFRTPLGDHPVDREYIQELILNHHQFTASNASHRSEHCLEVQYPFIQMVCPNVPTVPVLFGNLDPLEIGEVLNTELKSGDFIIVSSDLSHYHNNVKAHALDHQFIDAVLNGDLGGVAKGEACGQAPTMTLMTIAAKNGWQPHLLDYRTSGDIIGDRSQVVGYAAFAYVDGG
jgi:AmmeMemoRadiSam system protein B